MTEFLHEKYKEFIRYNYGIQSGYCMYNNMEELMCEFATEVAKEYIEMASKLENENKELKNELQQSKEIIIDVLPILTEDIPIGVTSVKSYNKYLMCNRIKNFLKGENKNA